MNNSNRMASSGLGSDPPKVSIIIPCYNTRSSFLQQAVESARGQSYSAKEIIVIDDGSTKPETIKIIDSLPPDIEVIRQPNRGLAAARNRGIEAANGHYVLPLDSDDWIEPYFVKEAIEKIIKHQNAFVYTWTQTFGNYDMLIRNRWSPCEQPIVNTIPYCILIPKELWNSIGQYDVNIRIGGEDWDFNVRLALAKANGLCLPKPAFHYQVSLDSMLHSITFKRYYEVIRQMEKKYPDCYRPSYMFRHLRSVPAYQRNYPGWMAIMFYSAYKLLPNRGFSALFRTVISLRTLMRRYRATRNSR